MEGHLFMSQKERERLKIFESEARRTAAVGSSGYLLTELSIDATALPTVSRISRSGIWCVGAEAIIESEVGGAFRAYVGSV